MEIKREPLSKYTSLRIGGEATIVAVNTIEEMSDAIMHAKAEGHRVHILGGGTNTYFEENLKDLFIIKNEIMGISIKTSDSQRVGQLDKDDTVLVACGAGEIWDDVVEYAVERGLWGVENLSYIPGTVGAAPVQNIGAYGSELSDVFVSLTAIDFETLEVVVLDKTACQFGYRDSIFKRAPGKYAICSVTLSLSKTKNPVLTYKPLDSLADKENVALHEIRNVVVSTRKAKLPDWKEYPNAGSFFKNPIVAKDVGEGLRGTYPEIPLHEVAGGYKIPAAWLIEHVAHMKGVRMGEVGTWPNQPLVIVNYGKARAEDLTLFSDELIKVVEKSTGILLEKEVNLVAC